MKKENWQERCARLNYNMFDCWKYDSGEDMDFDYYVEETLGKGG